MRRRDKLDRVFNSAAVMEAVANKSEPNANLACSLRYEIRAHGAALIRGIPSLHNVAILAVLAKLKAIVDLIPRRTHMNAADTPSETRCENPWTTSLKWEAAASGPWVLHTDPSGRRGVPELPA